MTGVNQSKGSGAKAKVAHNRETLRTTGPVSPGDFLIAQEGLQRSLPRHHLLAASHHTERSVCVFKAWRNLSVRCGSERKPNPGAEPTASRWSAPGPGKRTRREDHALLIVRDEFRTGYSLIGLLASIARLRFPGNARITLDGRWRIGLSSNCNCVFSLVSHRRGSPQTPVLSPDALEAWYVGIGVPPHGRALVIASVHRSPLVELVAAGRTSAAAIPAARWASRSSSRVIGLNWPAYTRWSTIRST